MKSRGIIRHDLVYGLAAEWKKLILLVVLALFCCIGLTVQINLRALSQRPTFLDCALYLFGGMEPYIPSADVPFKIPVTWLILHSYLAYWVGSYPVDDLQHYGKNVLLRCEKRATWWRSKLIWCAASVLVFYAVCYLVMALFCLFIGTLSFAPTYEIQETVSHLYLQRLENKEIWFIVLILPILTSLALSLVQMVFYLWVAPIFSYIAVISYLVISAYCATPFLIGNYSMIFRHERLMDGGASSVVCVVVDIGIIVAAIGIGHRKFKRYDILSK